MEKNINRYATIVRYICYITIPILLFTIITCGMSIGFFYDNYEDRNINNYFETQIFSNIYMNSIINNIENCYSNMYLGSFYFRKEYLTNNNIERVYYNDYGNENDGNIFNGEEGIINYREYLENRNFKFLIIDNKTNTAFTNLPHTMKNDSIDKIIEELSENKYYWNYKDKQISTNIENLSIENIKYEDEYSLVEKKFDCTIYTSMSDKLDYNDTYYEYYLMYTMAKPIYDTAFINIPICVLLIILCIFLITINIGKKKGVNGIYLNVFDKLPLGVAGGLIFCLILASIIFIAEMDYDIISIMFLIIVIVIIYIALIISYDTFIKRIKSHTLLKNTIIYRTIKAIKKGINEILSNLKLTTLVGVVLTISIIGIYMLAHMQAIGVFLIFVIWVISFKKIYEEIKKFMNIKEKVRQIYEGNTDIKINEDEYTGVLKELCIYINDIAGGFTNAIEENLKSERMKTELITNVSHDIKTPLTSIINYVDLLKKENIKNQKAKEYLQVLDKKSQRLKRLTEDLVEASKASSGNIKLNMEKLDVKELIKQVSGEFEDKINESQLELVLGLPEEETIIMADSRYLYRVIENMYSNIVKYALPQSRVYVDIVLDKNKLQIQLKNISKEKLNISADELMQRFVRGDVSRNTEGSGLGLSIAQSLVELQNGKFNIYLDGDLFKVTIEFTLPNQN